MKLFDSSESEELHAETMFLGCCIIGGRPVASPHRDILRQDAFGFPHMGIIAASIGEMLDEGKHIELVTLAHKLRDKSHGGKPLLDIIGGEDALVEIAMSNYSLTSVGHYADIIKERDNRRRIFTSARDLASDAKNPDITMSQLVAKAQGVSQESARLIPKSMFAHISDISIEGDIERGIPTGIDGLDSQITMGGFPSGQMSLIRAYHKGGKSTMMIQSGLAAAASGHRVLYATFADLNRKHIKRRMMRMLTGWQDRPQNEHLFGDWDVEHSRLNSMSIDIYDAAEVDGYGSVEEFVSWAESGGKPAWDIVFVDYAQELVSSSRKIHGKMEEQMECARVLNRFAHHNGIAVVVGSQITTDLAGQKRTKWGRDWEEKAGWVLSLNPPVGGDPTLSTIEISYSRFGPQKPRSNDIQLRFNSALLVLEEV